MNPTKPTLEDLKNAIRNVPDFPQPGIQFKDISPILADPTLFAASIDLLVADYAPGSVRAIAGIDARGFLFAAAAALKLGAGVIPIRKKGKLPYQTLEESYSLEYGTSTLAIHVDAVQRGDRVLLIDDLLATGGTAWAAGRLLQRLGAEIVGMGFLIELAFLHGRDRLKDYPVRSYVVF